jgi:hypothetical protein
VQSEEECAVGHGHENAIQAPRAYNGFSSNGNNPLKAVSQSRGAPQLSPFPSLISVLNSTVRVA